jgi:hypothetical protein
VAGEVCCQQISVVKGEWRDSHFCAVKDTNTLQGSRRFVND